MPNNLQQQIQEQKQKELQSRVDVFVEDLQKLSVKHKVVVVPILRSTPQGIYPDVTFADKEDFEKKTSSN